MRKSVIFFSQGVFLVISVPKLLYFARYISTRHRDLLRYDTKVNFRVVLSS